MELHKPLSHDESRKLATKLNGKKVEAIKHVSGAVLVMVDERRGPVFRSEKAMREVIGA